MSSDFEVTAIGNAIVDVIAPATDSFLESHGLRKGAMTLVDDARAAALYDAMAPGLEASGGSAANTVAGAASLGGRCAYVGKVASDQLGEVFAHDIRSIGAAFQTEPLDCGPATGRCLINVTPDGHRTMATFLGAASQLLPEDVDPAVIRASRIVYLEGYLFDPPPAREAFRKAAEIAHAAGARVAMTLSDVFVVERWREAILAFLPEIDIVVANEQELLSLYTGADFETALDRLADVVRTVAVTRSEKGSVLREGADKVSVSALPAEVVDTTGAGDQYAAGLLLGLARGHPLGRCGELGALCAHEVIGHYGPRPLVSLAEAARARGLGL